MRDDRTTAGLAMAVGSYLTYGLLAPAGKILLADLAPFSLNAWRSVLGLAVVSLWAGPRAIRAALPLFRHWRLVLVVWVGGGLSFSTYYHGLQFVDATTIALGFFTAPLWTGLLQKTWLGEPLGLWFWPAVAGVLVGGYFAVGGLQGDLHPVGIGMALATAMGWAVYSVGLRRYGHDIPLRPLTWLSFVVWSVYFALPALALHGLDAPQGAGWAWMAVLVLGPTVLSILLLYGALQRAPAASVNVFVGLEVAATALFAFLLLGDTFTATQLAGIGGVVAVVTVYLAMPIQSDAAPV